MAENKRSSEGEQCLWIVDQAVAIVENGRVTLQIDLPTRYLPRSKAFHVADKIWFANQMRELEIARQQRVTKEIPLTDRRRRSSLRLGGGFMITQGKRLVMARRHMDAPRPGQFCECGGVFEAMVPSSQDDQADVINDYIAALLKESQEIAIIRGDTLYIPQLSPSPLEQIGFQPPGKLDAYNKIIENELKMEAEKAHVPFNSDKVRYFWMKLLDYDQSVRLQFAYSPELSVEITAEIDTSSLECVGVLSLPENLFTASISYLEEKILTLKKKANKNPSEELIIEKNIKKIQKEIKEIEKERKKSDEFQYWDCELGWDPELKKEAGAVDREIHLVDIETCDDTVWYVPKDKKRRRDNKQSKLWEELSATKLGPTGTSGRFATEKLEKAIKMHSPFHRLQPLITL